VKRYSAERTEAILRQMMPPTNKLVSALAREHGISEQTLYTWRRNLQAQGVPVPGNGKKAEEWSSKDKFGVVLETAGLNEAELAEYCRRKGLFIEQIAAYAWDFDFSQRLAPWPTLSGLGCAPAAPRRCHRRSDSLRVRHIESLFVAWLSMLSKEPCSSPAARLRQRSTRGRLIGALAGARQGGRNTVPANIHATTPESWRARLHCREADQPFVREQPP
jgi:transposase-like protein